MSSASLRVPLPSIALPPREPSGKRYCTNPAHVDVSDCLQAAAALRAPVSGEQSCLLQGLQNAQLMFQQLMVPDATSLEPYQLPPRALAAGPIWSEFERAVVGCLDYIAEQGGPPFLLKILEVYTNFASPVERALALALRLDYAQPPPDFECKRALRIQLQGHPVLRFVYLELHGKMG